ncbi:MAG: FkbM family methyltransferase [Bacteroidota bacterium]
MLDKLYRFYARLCARPSFYKLNKTLFELSLRGLGVLNSHNFHLSGEYFFIEKVSQSARNQLIIDIGGNIGNYSLDFLKKNPEQQIFVFEPHPTTFQKLSQNLNSYKQVELFNKGVSDEKGELKLFDYQDQDGSTHASLFQGVIEDIHGKTSISHTVDVVALDDFLTAKKVEQVHLLKIDTEGNELNVLQGAKQYLEAQRIDIIHIEFNEMNVISKTFFKDFYDLLAPNYYLYRLLPKGVLPLQEYIPVRMELLAFQNIIAVSKSSNYHQLFR